MSTPAEYTPHDAAVWHTRAILATIRDGRGEQLLTVPTSFAPRLGPGERVLVRGGFELLTFRPLGDGTYDHRGGFFLATGRGGLAASAAVAGVRALGNARRRADAAAAAVPRWVVDDVGAAFVSTHGFYLDTGHALLPWSWWAVDSMELVEPRAVHVRGQASTGPVSWIVRSDWAELMFVLWALVRHPGHPQLAAGGWVPAGWAERDARRHTEAARIEGPADDDAPRAP